MSKAFARDSDDDSGDDFLPARPQLPPGVVNYITAAGAQKLRAELHQLTERKRLLASNAEQSNTSNEDELRRLQNRIRQFQAILQSVTVARPGPRNSGKVQFGCTVIVRNQEKEITKYQIVGLDEADPQQGRISWRSPLACQLLNQRAGSVIRFRSPAGEEDLEILEVTPG